MQNDANTTARNTDNTREALPADGVHGTAALRTLDDLSAAVARLAARNAQHGTTRQS
jgi:hypothetical protein